MGAVGGTPMLGATLSCRPCAMTGTASGFGFRNVLSVMAVAVAVAVAVVQTIPKC